MMSKFKTGEKVVYQRRPASKMIHAEVITSWERNARIRVISDDSHKDVHHKYLTKVEDL